MQVEMTVLGQVEGLVWGTGAYTDDSEVGAAAVHAGKVNVGETGVILVRCSGPQASFTGSTQNGVTSQSYGAWGASFSFEDVVPDAPAPAPQICYSEPCVYNKCAITGSEHNIRVNGVASGNGWGTDFYTDDSFVGVAAVHQGVLSPGETGAVIVVCTGARSSYVGSTQNGVTTQSYSYWPYSFKIQGLGAPPPPPPPENTCEDACAVNRCGTIGREQRIRVVGSAFGYGWGSGPFTDDTFVGFAAVHAGILQPDQVGEVILKCEGEQNLFVGSVSNAVATQNFGYWGASYSLTAAPTPVSEACSGSCIHTKCIITGTRHYITVTGYADSQIWGTDKYSDDSPVGMAAVHAGLLNAGQTKQLVATCSGSVDELVSSTANGVTSNSFGFWGYTYSLELA
jgi:hypothetical protein